MPEASHPIRKRQITTRLRAALLICALAAAAIPVIVYFATAEVMERQEDLSDRLITSVGHSAELNAALVRLADDTEKLGRFDSPDTVEVSSRSILAGLVRLRGQFAAEYSGLGDRTEAKGITKQLSAYEQVVAEVADNRIAQLRSLSDIEELRAEINILLRDGNSRLRSEIATLSAAFELRMSRAARQDVPDDGTELAAGFQSLTLYRALTQLLEDIEERIADIDTASTPKNPDDIATGLRFLTRGVSTRIAKVPNPSLRQSLARDMLALDFVLLGPGSIVVAYRDYLAHDEIGASITAEQAGIATRLLDYSDGVIAASRSDALQSSRDVASLIRENRLTVLGLSTLLVLVLFVLLFLVVGRGFSRRIRSLTGGVLAIARGDIDHKIDIRGDDELSAMSDALHVFRENRRDLSRTNEKLAASNREVREVGTRLKTVLDTTTSGIIAFNRDDDIIMVNLHARHFLGDISTPTPFPWPDTVEFLDTEDFSRLGESRNPIRRAQVGQQLRSEIALMKRSADEEAQYMRISSAVVADETSPVRCVVALEDVSEAEKNRQQVERAGRLDALGQLTGGIAHDFNNLLATIEYALELSISTGVNDEAKSYLKTATGSVRRGAELTARLLSFAKRQPGRARSQRVTDILQEFRALAGPSIEEIITLTFEERAPDLYVYCDSGQLENALLNLVLNSRDSILRSGQGDRITISVREVTEVSADFGHGREQPDEAVYREVAADTAVPGEPKGSRRYVEFAVTDNGPGMSVEVKRRALDPFFTTKEINSGTGLGLSMVYGFIRHSDGELRLYSEEGHGTTIRMLLPSGSPEGEREGPVANLPIQKGNGESILIVEDDIELRQIMAELVRSLGYSAEIAGSGRDALKMFEDGLECDVLLTDIVMPGGIGGFELGEQVRAFRPSIPIVYMSGYTGFTEVEMGSAIGRSIQKPCSPSELSEAIAASIGSTADLVEANGP